MVYNTAQCLIDQAQLQNDSVKAQQAHQLLKSTLALSGKLDGPETVRKFESLLARIPANPVVEKSKPKSP